MKGQKLRRPAIHGKRLTVESSSRRLRGGLDEACFVRLVLGVCCEPLATGGLLTDWQAPCINRQATFEGQSCGLGLLPTISGSNTTNVSRPESPGRVTPPKIRRANFSVHRSEIGAESSARYYPLWRAADICWRLRLRYTLSVAARPVVPSAIVSRRLPN